MNISVIMPCHNCEPWIQDALKSAAGQSRQPNEIIVIDDKSTDGSVEKVEESGISVKLIRTQYGNAAASRNEGVQQATGDWVAFLDADDIWLENHLEIASSILQEGDRAYFCRHKALISGQEIDVERGHRVPPFRQGGLDRGDLYREFVRPNSGWPTSGMMICRQTLLDIGGFDEQQVRRHDAELFVRAASICSWAFSSQPTWLYRIHSKNNISSNSLECSYYWCLALGKINRLLIGSEMKLMRRKQARKCISLAMQNGARKAVWRAVKINKLRIGVLVCAMVPVLLIYPTFWNFVANHVKRRLR